MQQQSNPTVLHQTGLLESTADDTPGPLPRPGIDNQLVILTLEEYSKLMQAVFTSKT